MEIFGKGVITYFNVYFDKTNVEVTRTSSGGKSREAFCDIVAEINFSFYDKNGVFKDLNNFFPGWEERTRIIFVGKDLGTVRTLVARGDSDAAMEESLGFVNSADKNLAARANFNCAVFY